MSGMSDRWRIEVHEAGHCVAARLMRLPCGGASIAPDDIAYAYVPVDCGWMSACMLMAGALSEAICLGDDDEHGCSWDWELIDDLGLDASEIDGLWGYTFALMEPRQRLIERVAEALSRAQMLSGDEIDALISQ